MRHIKGPGKPLKPATLKRQSDNITLDFDNKYGNEVSFKEAVVSTAPDNILGWGPLGLFALPARLENWSNGYTHVFIHGKERGQFDSAELDPKAENLLLRTPEGKLTLPLDPAPENILTRTEAGELTLPLELGEENIIQRNEAGNWFAYNAGITRVSNKHTLIHRDNFGSTTTFSDGGVSTAANNLITRSASDGMLYAPAISKDPDNVMSNATGTYPGLLQRANTRIVFACYYTPSFTTIIPPGVSNLRLALDKITEDHIQYLVYTSKTGINYEGAELHLPAGQDYYVTFGRSGGSDPLNAVLDSCMIQMTGSFSQYLKQGECPVVLSREKYDPTNPQYLYAIPGFRVVNNTGTNVVATGNEGITQRQRMLWCVCQQQL